MWALVIVAQTLVFVQATLGTILARQRRTPELGDMHALYGFSAIVAVMIMYGYRTSPFLQGKRARALRLRQPVHDGPRHPEPDYC